METVTAMTCGNSSLPHVSIKTMCQLCKCRTQSCNAGFSGLQFNMLSESERGLTKHSVDSQSILN